MDERRARARGQRRDGLTLPDTPEGRRQAAEMQRGGRRAGLAIAAGVVALVAVLYGVGAVAAGEALGVVGALLLLASAAVLAQLARTAPAPPVREVAAPPAAYGQALGLLALAVVLAVAGLLVPRLG